MSDDSRRATERAALVQRIQLEALGGALRALEAEVGALEPESVRHSAEISRLAAEIAELRAGLGLEHPGAEELARSNVADRPAPDVREGTARARPLAPSPGMGTLPDAGEDWESYLRNVDRYIADHGIEVTRDPLAQLLPPALAASVRREFDAGFGPAPWDRWDYGAVALAVLAGALTDYLLVATPGGTFRGVPQRGSPLTAWMKEQSKKLAPGADADGIERNALQEWVAGLTAAAERHAKVPYDVVRPKVGLTPRAHRGATPGHDPLLGLVFGAHDIISGQCTFIDKKGAWRVIDATRHGGTSNVLEAVVRVVVHGFSDVFTVQGLPPPFLAPLQMVGGDSGLPLREGGDTVPVRDVVRYMYSNGYDLRHFAATAISPAFAEVILWAYHGVRALSSGTGAGEAGIPEKLKRNQMLVLAHGLLASANILKTALSGWNPMAINFAQFQVFAIRMFSLAKLASERDRTIQQRLDDGLRTLHSDARGSFPDP